MKKFFACLLLVPLIVYAMGAIVVFQWRQTPYGTLSASAALISRVAAWQESSTAGTDIVATRAARRQSMPYVVGPVPRLAKVTNISIARDPASAGIDKSTIAARLYQPNARRPGTGPQPILIYYHGGGWALGDLDSHDNVCRHLAIKTGHLVLAVDYRLAPEHVFPAALDDAYAALIWVAEQGARIGADPARITLAGDSAGGNLAAAVSLRARERKGPAIAAQALIYPATDLTTLERNSQRSFATGYFLTRARMGQFFDMYVPDPAARKNPEASPLLANEHSGLPPTLILTAQFDPLRDEGEAYAAALKDAGVPVRLLRFASMIHGFVSMDRWFPEADQALTQVAEHLKNYTALTPSAAADRAENR